MNRSKIIIPFLAIFVLNLLILRSIENRFFTRQLIYWAAGGFLAFIIFKLKFSLSALSSALLISYIAGIVLLLLPLIFGALIRGSSRWLFIGEQSFQPAEFAKFLMAISWAGFLSLGDLSKLSRLLIFFGLFSLPVLMLLGEPNLGTALVFVFMALVMLFFSRVKKRQIFIALSMLFAGSLLFGKFFLADYQIRRLESFLHPQSDPLGGGYNLAQAITAFGSGKFFGRGLGLGSQTRLFFLPEKQTDFIFSSLGESFGFLGALILIFFYLYLFLFFLRISFEEKDEFSRILKTGLVSYLWFQTFVNMGINLGLLPVTGLPLPFFSYGGSSLISSFISLGLIMKE
ncbi:MAG: FtsW/RodA/SpoVE family cell cycle protein [Candidatus Shapirobacteria bacterium]